MVVSLRSGTSGRKKIIPDSVLPRKVFSTTLTLWLCVLCSPLPYPLYEGFPSTRGGQKSTCVDMNRWGIDQSTGTFRLPVCIYPVCVFSCYNRYAKTICKVFRFMKLTHFIENLLGPSHSVPIRIWDFVEETWRQVNTGSIIHWKGQNQ